MIDAARQSDILPAMPLKAKTEDPLLLLSPDDSTTLIVPIVPGSGMWSAPSAKSIQLEIQQWMQAQSQFNDSHHAMSLSLVDLVKIQGRQIDLLNTQASHMGWYNYTLFLLVFLLLVARRGRAATPPPSADGQADGEPVRE